MKRLLVVAGVISLVAAVLVPAGVSADAEQTVSCTVKAKLISLTVTDGSVAYGTLGLSPSAGSPTTKSTIDLVDTQVVTNNGNVTEDFDIKSSDAEGGTAWNLVAAASIATDAFAHQFSADSGSNWADLTDTYQSMATGVATSGTENVDLKIFMPTGTSDYDPKTITVTVLASGA